MITRAAIPNFVMPDRRTKEVDGIAIGKELTGLIRGAKTRGAINKALAQHGTLSSPEAIETVRQNMGTWFSSPQEIIKLQDTLYTREKDAQKHTLEGRKLDVQKEIAEDEIEAKETAAELLADTEIAHRWQDHIREVDARDRELKERRKDRIEEIEARREVAKALSDNQKRVAAKVLAAKEHENTRKRLELQTGSIDAEIKHIIQRATANLEQGLTLEDSTRITALEQQRQELTDIAIKTTFATDEEFDAYKTERDENRIIAPNKDEIQAKEALKLQQFKAKFRQELSEMSTEDLISRLPDSYVNWFELSDKLDDEVKNIAKLEERITQKERLNYPTASAIQNLGRDKKSLEKSNEKLARLRAEAEKTLLEQELKTFKTTTGDSAQSDFDPTEGPGLGAAGGGDLVDQFTQMALNSPQGQKMMRRLMEEQQIG